MKSRKVFSAFLIPILLLMTLSCKKNEAECYSKELYKQHKDDICTTDCPGVIGCDGETYCNECDANRKGIRVK